MHGEVEEFFALVTPGFCGSCHDVTLLNGFRLEEAFAEYKRTDAARQGITCQDCHMGRTNPDGSFISTRIARNPAGRDFPPTRPRSPFAKHDIVGGNTLVLGMFRDHGEELGTSAPREAFEATLAATRALLRTESAELRLLNPRVENGQLALEIEAINGTGHKLPTAHPTRRAWLHVRVTDAAGRLVFESGQVDEQGRIVDAQGQPLASELAGGPIEPHRNRIRSARTPVLYQAIMADLDGQPTHLLLRGAGFLKDTRLLPLGWSPEGPEATRTAPVGTTHDANFVGGGDRVELRAPLPPFSAIRNGRAGSTGPGSRLSGSRLAARQLSPLAAGSSMQTPSGARARTGPVPIVRGLPLAVLRLKPSILRRWSGRTGCPRSRPWWQSCRNMPMRSCARVRGARSRC